jgi:DNA-binding beta-propeller fold protein YncE
MDDFEGATLSWSSTEGKSRRELGQFLVGMVLGGLLTLLPETETPARKRNKRNRRRKSRWTNQTTFGGRGSEADEFDYPFGLAISDDTLTVLVADANNDRISVWTRTSIASTDWSHQTNFGSYGVGANELSWPNGVAISKDGLTVFVADSLNDRISVWTRSSAASADWTDQTTFGSIGEGASDFYSPESVAISSDGLTAFIVDMGNARISVWTRSSAHSTDWANQTTFGSFGSRASEFNLPFDCAVSSDDKTVFVADYNNNRISIWTRSSSSSTDWTHQTNFGASKFDGTAGVSVSEDGLQVFVADDSRISVWRRSRAARTGWTHQVNFGTKGTGPQQFKWPTDVLVSGDGNTVFVADPYNYRISGWTRS